MSKQHTAIFLFVAILLSNLLYGQVKQEVQLRWNEPQSESLFPEMNEYSITFQGYQLSDAFGLLPVYSKAIPLESNHVEVDISLNDCVYQDVQLPENAALIDHQRIDSIPLTSYKIEKYNEGWQLFVQVLPMRLDPAAQALELLQKFMLSVEITEKTAGIANPRNNVIADESVLSSGNWIKIKIHNSGIHKISFEDLLEAGINLDGIDPDKIQLFGNGNGMLPERNNVARTDDLLENAIFIHGDEDNVFNEGDYILFYGLGAVRWEYNPFKKLYSHQTHLYDDHTYYYLTYGQAEGKRIEQEAASGLTANYQSATFAEFKLYEEDLHNLLKTGKLWLGPSLKDENTLSLDFGFENINSEKTARLNLSYTVRTPNESFLNVKVNDEEIDEIELPTVHLGSSQYSLSETKTYSFTPTGDELMIDLHFTPYDNNSNLWIDYVEMNLSRDLVFDGGQMFFSDPSSIGANRISEFLMANPAEEMHVWEVTDPSNIVSLQVNNNGEEMSFVLKTDTIREFVAWDGSSFEQVEVIGEIPNQNLHAHQPAELIIVTHPLFEEYAKQLGDLHQNYDGLSYVLASTEQIYNEFSSGKQDPTAIRDYVKMIYNRATNVNRPRYLMLFGDGSYDPKGRDEGLYPNFITAYQSTESLKITYSFVTDDFYALMDPTEGFDAIGSPDLGVGRIPVNTAEQAGMAVEKIRSYIVASAENTDDWRNEIYFIADDEDGNTHVNQAEKLAAIIDTASKQYHVNKIYHDAYQQISLPGGDRYPEVNENIDEAVRNGALLFNYTGHGGELGWSSEKVLNIPTVNSWDNLDKLPVFITATCEFSRFDNQEFESAGELVFLNEQGGGIALFTTTRLSYSSTNFTLNKRLYQNTFDSIRGDMPRLGDIMRLSKEVSSNFIKNFVLLGDPAMKLAYPRYRAITTSVESGEQRQIDTLKALSKIYIKGKILDANGNKLEDFNGYVVPRIYDKYTAYSTLGNDNNSSPVNYKVRDKCLFEGRASVTRGDFEFEFVVPRDIDFSYGNGKILYYALDTATYEDANGYKVVSVGGYNENPAIDHEGPDLDMYLNHTRFKSGDQVGIDPVLIADISDPSGINFFGNGIGHDISITIDNDPGNSYIVNDFYTPAMDDFTSGSVIFPLNNLDAGTHTLSMKVWDVYNNSSTKSIDFVIGNTQVANSQISNYPNPFQGNTTFKIRTDDYESPLNFELKIFSLQGRLLNDFAGVLQDGNSIAELEWNGRNVKGELLDNGTYIYILKLTDADGNKRILANKLVIIN
ncbi:MAG: type IX secretion system sortase PorU [Bacteroidales bacterium]|nr:type IX secretion system sortase PorU [Bacteroidales bacterium]MCF8396720.1 type IX secretion system sortase PorU [Bacteroidales bacterium]